MPLHALHCENLYSDIDLVPYVKREMLHKEVVCYERVFPELNFYGDPVFNKICLIVAKDCFFSLREHFSFLLLRSFHQSRANQTLRLRDPIRNATLFQGCKVGMSRTIERNWAVASGGD